MHCGVKVLLFFLFALVLCEDYPEYKVALAPRNLIWLHWKPLPYWKTLEFEISFAYLFVGTWFAFGFSERGELNGADLCILWRDSDYKLHFQDTWTDQDGIVHVDKQQDCSSFELYETGEKLSRFKFRKKLDTCDEYDYIIDTGTIHVVWASGREVLRKIEGLELGNVRPNLKGMVRVQLVKNTHGTESLPDNTFKMDFLARKVKVPRTDTTYWCQVFRLPERFDSKHHVVKYESVIQKGNENLVHHMELFHCEAPPERDIPTYAGKCDSPGRPAATQVCKKVLAAWAMGATAFFYPKEVGLPIGGRDFSKYVMIEVHYNNPKLLEWTDSSGMRLYVTTDIRPNDAGIMELGLEYTDKMAIPPKQPSFKLSGYCIASCTSVGLPKDGIVIFGSQLHTHLTGIKVTTRQIRNGVELPLLNHDEHFSTHFQEIRRLKNLVRVLPGDALITTCVYDTMTRENITLGGFSIKDEMCVNYIHYYPPAKLEVCKSSISDQHLVDFYRYMNEWEYQKTSAKKGRADNYNSIDWTPQNVQLLEDLYSTQPISMQCNMSEGTKFPGSWDNAPLTFVDTPLRCNKRSCRDAFDHE